MDNSHLLASSPTHYLQPNSNTTTKHQIMQPITNTPGIIAELPSLPIWREISRFSYVIMKISRHDKTKYFIESMLTTGYLPVITKPTRITDHTATLLDHIYSNSKSLNYQSGIIITDIADHFGTFYVSRKNHVLQYRIINIFEK